MENSTKKPKTTRKRDKVKEVVKETLHKAKENVVSQFGNFSQLIEPKNETTDLDLPTTQIEESTSIIGKIVSKIVYNSKERLLYDPFFSQPKVNWDRYTHLKITAYKTIYHQSKAWIYHANYVKVLSEFGVDMVGSIKNQWWNNNLDYMIVVEDYYTGEMSAGIRILIADENTPLPMEEAIKSQNPDIIPRIHRFDNVIGEVCGMWVKKKFSERGLAHILNVCALSMAERIRVKYLLAMPPKHTVKHFESLGYTRVRIGNNAEYEYPDPRYISTAMEINCEILQDTPMVVRDKILSLRVNPQQQLIEESNGYVTKIDYSLSF